jgi:hypothetical protein
MRAVRDRGIASPHRRPTGSGRYAMSELRYEIDGLPDPIARGYNFDARTERGDLDVVALAGTMGYVYKPRGLVDPARRWVLISPMYLGLDSVQQGGLAYAFYVEALLAAGFHVAGIDIGITCGSPAGAAIYDRFYEHVVGAYSLNPKARAIAQSNGGLRVYAWAFRHPDAIERIFGVFPVLDLRDWPRLERISTLIPPGLAYPLSTDALARRLSEFNPIDNLAPLAASRVKLFHVHGDRDASVHLEPNSLECARRYRALGGSFELEVVPGGTHARAPVYYENQRGLAFLLQP